MAGKERDTTPKHKRKHKKPDDQAQVEDQQGPVGDQGPSPEEKPSEPQPPEEQGEAAETQTPREEPAPAETSQRAPCPVVGVGASAGGLEALQGLFANLPPAPGVAFVVVQHRAMDRTSVMRSLIEKHTKLEVRDIADNMSVEPDTIYLAPADKDVSLLNGVLYLSNPPSRAGVHLPIDSFLRTLAQDEVERAVCIILSGTGSDGTLGSKEVKAAGGMIMAQKEDQAKYDSMPRSIIETGMVDFVLPVEKMGEQLVQYIRHPYLERRKAPEPEAKVENQLQKIFVLIRNETGHDFSHYKRNTIRRRISRRLAVHQIEDLAHYIKLLQESPEEIRVLAREMLITVTNFFRDSEAWDSLAELVIRPLVEQKPPDQPLRVWVAGCATGEEAYSVALLCYEQMSKSEMHHALQIFATDLDEESINVARTGIYPKSIAADVSPERLGRFFTDEGNTYKVKGNVREALVFAKHNLIKDAPFSKLDLICCRNVLIYMDTMLQKKLMPMFHYVLNQGGYLFLGESESIGTFADLYTPMDSKHKIFRRKAIETGYELGAADMGFRPPQEAGGAKLRPARPAHNVAEVAERVILRDYSLPCVLVNEDYEIVYFNGDTSPYLIQPSGRPTFNIIQMARPEIHFRLNLLLKRAFHEKRIALEKNVQIRVNDHYLETDIVVRPVAEAGVGENLMLVVFKGRPKDMKKEGNGGPSALDLPEEEKDARIRELGQELQSTKEYLQTTIEELETSNEELKSSNEELQSTNEELQSTNEELDTSREELQSTNEELRTVNTEHQQKIDELSNAYDDQTNLLQTTDVASLFLDRELRIRRFTPAARNIFRLIDRDVGRPLSDITSNLHYPTHLKDIRNVLEALARLDEEVQTDRGEWYQMKAIPYRTADDVIDGVVVTFINITEHKKLLAAAREEGEFAAAIVETVRQPLLVLSPDLKIIDGNPSFYRFFETSPEETIGRRIYQLGSGQWDLPELRRLLEQIVPADTWFEGFQMQATFPRIGERTLMLNARQTMHKGKATGRILLAFEDVTGKEESERKNT